MYGSNEIIRLALAVLPHLAAYQFGLYSYLQHPAWYRTLFTHHRTDCGPLVFYSSVGNLVAASIAIFCVFPGFQRKHRNRIAEWLMQHEMAYVAYSTNLTFAVLWPLLFMNANMGNYRAMAVVAMAGLAVAIATAVAMYMFDGLAWTSVSSVHLVYLGLVCGTTLSLYVIPRLARL